MNRTSYLTVAEETLPQASINRGIPGMNSPVRGGANLFDGGAASKPQVNSQPYNNERLLQQNMLQNVSTAAPQAAAGAMGQVRKQTAEISNAEQKARQFASDRKSEVIYALAGGAEGMNNSAIGKMGAMSDLDTQRMMESVATGKAMAQGMNPDLGAAEAEARMYG